MKQETEPCIECSKPTAEPVFCEGCAEALHPECGENDDGVYWCSRCWEGGAAEVALIREDREANYAVLEAKATDALRPLARWAKNCHGASYELVKAGLADRVARGVCRGVLSQHSWAVVGMDCYDLTAIIIDATRWSYGSGDPSVLVQRLGDGGGYRPHGQGNIWQAGRPPSTTGTPVELTPSNPLGSDARLFLDLLGPLDIRGWSLLIHSPVGGWPAGEILSAAADTKGLAALIPIDRLGMLTDRNPGGLYLRGEPAESTGKGKP